MKKYSLIAIFVLILIAILVSTYFYFLEIVYENKTIAQEVQTFASLKETVARPIATYTPEEALLAKRIQYDAMLQELGLKATVTNDQQMLLIQGSIVDTQSYLLVKQFLDIVKNDDVEMVNSCIGKECGEGEFGFSLTLHPYALKLPQ